MQSTISLPSAARTIAAFFLLFAWSLTNLGCGSLFNSEAADAQWRVDYAQCRFGKTPEQLEAINQDSEAKAPYQNVAWKACLTEKGWNIDPGRPLGPEWED